MYPSNDRLYDIGCVYVYGFRIVWWKAKEKAKEATPRAKKMPNLIGMDWTPLSERKRSVTQNGDQIIPYSSYDMVRDFSSPVLGVFISF